MNIEDLLSNIRFFWELFQKNGFFNKDRYYIEEENIRLDCASLAKNIAEINRNVCPNKIVHNYTVNGNKLICDMEYEGIVRKNNTSGMYFTFTSTNQINYDDIDCFAIVNNQKQRPRLKGPDGLVKKYEVLFEELLKRNTNYSIKFILI